MDIEGEPFDLREGRGGAEISPSGSEGRRQGCWIAVLGSDLDSSVFSWVSIFFGVLGFTREGARGREYRVLVFCSDWFSFWA